MVFVIGITGKKGHGKDTVGKILNKYGYKRIAFADPLKEACRCIFGFTDEQLYGDEKEKTDPFWNVTPRHILQYVGTDLFRDQLGFVVPDLGKDIWIKSAEKHIESSGFDKIVITDVRFQNEVDMILKKGGYVVRVTRPSIKSGDTHVSETHIDDLVVNNDILNDGTIEDLEQKVKDILISLAC
uniref:Deoxynucleoside monophosphate kinase n=1 Tax=viral metagenome TaxID=1070528 RepID=A0A6C0EFE5_9ZZZZ